MMFAIVSRSWDMIAFLGHVKHLVQLAFEILFIN